MLAKRFLKLSSGLIGLGFFAVSLNSCGGSGGGGVDVNSLGQLPTASELITSSSSTNALQRYSVARAATGTPPLITELKEDPDTYFWNGLLSELNDDGFTWNLKSEATKEEYRRKFWGEEAGEAGGQAACWNAQGFGYSMQNVFQSSTSGCYMARMPNASSGFTSTAPVPEDTLKQEEATKLIKVDIENDPFEDEMGEEDVWIKVYGTNEIGANRIKFELNFCNSETNQPRGREIIEVNKSTGAYSAISVGDDGWNHRLETTGTLKKKRDGSGFEFDQSKERSVLIQATHGEDNIFNSHLIISDGVLRNKVRERNTWNDGMEDVVWTASRYIVSSFSGSSVSTLRLIESGFREQSSCEGPLWCDDEHANREITAASTWQGDFYEARRSGDFFSEANEFSFASDSFFGEISEPDTSEMDDDPFDCANATATYQVTIDMQDPGIEAVTAACENHFEDHDICWSNEVREAEDMIRQSWENP